MRLFSNCQLPLICCNVNQVKGTTLPSLPGGEGQGGMIRTMLEAPVALAEAVKLRTTITAAAF
jgi:hypothetical protein